MLSGSTAWLENKFQGNNRQTCDCQLICQRTLSDLWKPKAPDCPDLFSGEGCGLSSLRSTPTLMSLAKLWWNARNTGHNTSTFVHYPPTTDQRALANGNRLGRQKQDGGNKNEGEQEWTLFVIIGSSAQVTALPC
ncbi:hypothetical protein J6590_080256 [Homalodisca vitripennis]|nr:hypothetical protein J6590_080256 [Homalodisca vitripennis]